jgi:hypothetical protein
MNWLMFFNKIIAVYSEDHTKPINTLSGQNAELLMVKGGDTYSYHWILKGYTNYNFLRSHKGRLGCIFTSMRNLVAQDFCILLPNFGIFHQEAGPQSMGLSVLYLANQSQELPDV